MPDASPDHPTPHPPDPHDAHAHDEHAHDAPAVDAIAAELVRRLRPLLGTMPETEFLDLVHAIARRRHRWDQQARTRGP